MQFGFTYSCEYSDVDQHDGHIHGNLSFEILVFVDCGGVANQGEEEGGEEHGEEDTKQSSTKSNLNINNFLHNWSS